MQNRKSSQYIIRRELFYYNSDSTYDYIWSYSFNNPDAYPWFEDNKKTAQIFTKDQAEQIIKELNESIYYLSGNEYSRPDYKIIPV